MWQRRLKLTVLTVTCVVSFAMATIIWMWNDRPSTEDVAWPAPPAPGDNRGTVIVTWLGVTTLLFDDGQTQILIDGFFSRPTLADILLRRPVDNDAPMINFAMNEYRMRHLAAIIPVHSHFDHAMDIGEIANRSSASVLGSESTANIARGAGVPEDQIVVAEPGQAYTFGEFEVTLLPSRHAPIGWRGAPPLPGTIDEPLVMPQPVSAMREGDSYAVLIRHPQGTAIVQGSAGFDSEPLEGVSADVVLLGIGGLGTLDIAFAEQFWHALVTSTGAKSVYPIHFDDFTKPFGEVVPWPGFLGDLGEIADWMETFRDRWDEDTALYLPRFGVPIALYEQSSSRT